jgi:OmpA-OmpF porin, OOP family
MKQTLLILSLIGTSIISNAQQFEKTKDEYNKWSIEVNGGLNNALYNWEGKEAPARIGHFDFGARFMLNSKFGFKGSFGYDQLKNADNNPNFKTNIYRYSLEGVFNIGRLLSFEDWTGRVGLLLHAGGGLSSMNYKNDTYGKRTDTPSHLMIGITPQVKINDKISLTFDVTSINNFQQKYTFDGYNRPESVIKGTGTVVVDNNTGITTIEIADPSTKFLKHINPIVNVTFGITYHLGKNKKHVDWEDVQTENDIITIQ